MRKKITRTLAATILTLFLGVAASPSRGDELRNLKRGEPMPGYKLAAIDGATIDSDSFKGSVLVLVYLSAEQRTSELAAMDSRTVLGQFAGEPVRLVHVTADVAKKPYFEQFRRERDLHVPLGLDADRSLYGKLGLIVFPTTVIVNKEGKLAQVISIHTPEYPHVLDSYVRHTLGLINDAQLEDRLKAKTFSEGAPTSVASSHRGVARLLRDKGQLDAARAELNKAREQDANNPEILLDLADLDVAVNKLDEADTLTQTVLGAHPDHRRAKQTKGIILYRQGHLAEAESTLLDALSLNPEPAHIHYYLGKIYEKKGEPAKALEHYREALQRLLNEPDEPATK